MGELAVRVLIPGSCAAPALVVAPLSFWGGCDPASGRVVDPHHPQFGVSVRGRFLVMQGAVGSSSSSSVLAEVLRLGTGPAAIALEEADGIVVVGVAVAAELYGVGCPVVLAADVTSRVRTGDLLTLEAGRLHIASQIDDGDPEIV